MSDEYRPLVHWCVMCPFETTNEAEAYEHDCMANGPGRVVGEERQ
jgi:hypothetical protein